MRVLASDNQLREMTVNDGNLIKRNRDGTFHVDDRTGKSLVKGSEFGQVGINLRSARGYRCGDCGHLGVFKNRCGKCGGTDLLEED